MITMEQEVLRAHQRATNKHPPLSVCAVLMENLLLNATGGAVNEGEVGGARHDVRYVGYVYCVYVYPI